MKFLVLVGSILLLILVDGWMWLPIGVALLYSVSWWTRRRLSGKWWTPDDSPMAYGGIILGGLALGAIVYAIDEVLKLLFSPFL